MGRPRTGANLRLARASSRASAKETSAAAPSPISRRRPRMTSLWIQLLVPVGCTNKYNPLPSACRPGGRGPDEGGSERLVGMAASALGSAGCGGGVTYSIHPRIIYGIGLDFAICPDRPSP